MSYQAITDFLLNPAQLQTDYKNFTSNKDTFSIQSSTSFEELVSFYSEMNESPAEENLSVENNTSAQNVQEKKAEKETENVKSEEKTEDNAEKEVASAEKSEVHGEEKVFSAEKNEPEAKTAVHTEQKGLKETPAKLSDDVKKVSKDDVADRKKSIAKEFDRMQHLTEEKLPENAVAVANIASSDKKNDLKLAVKEEQNKESAPIEGIAQKKESVELQNFVAEAKNQNQDNEFSSDKKGGEGQKTFTLDKEGKITVHDLRTERNPVAENAVASSSERMAEPEGNKKSALKVSDIKMTDSNTAEITMDVAANAQTDVLSLNSQTASANGSNFQAMLSNQIQSNASEFVKAGTLVLKDNNQGTINLVLHPDDLGNVKVHLSLDGKTMSAHITVSSKEALQVFKDNSETLREAFIKGGFDVSDFEVAYNDGGSFNQNMEFSGQQEQNNFMASRVYNSLGSGEGGAAMDLDFAGEKIDEFSNYSINIVA